MIKTVLNCFHKLKKESKSNMFSNAFAFAYFYFYYFYLS